MPVPVVLLLALRERQWSGVGSRLSVVWGRWSGVGGQESEEGQWSVIRNQVFLFLRCFLSS